MNFNFQLVNLFKLKHLFFLLVAFGCFFWAQAKINKGGRDKLQVNEVPVFDTNNYSYTISEEVPTGSSPGTVSATDGDDDPLSYSIRSGNINSAFKINSSTGLITVFKRLNHHTQDKFSLIVKVSDPGGLADEALVVINVIGMAAAADFDVVTWGTAQSQPYTISESQGKVVNGNLYTFGGFDSQKPGFTPTSRAYRFDPALNTWTGIAAMPPMNGTSYGGVTHAGFTTDNTDIYFAGGYTSNAAGNGQKFGTKEVWKYIVAENRYVRMPDLPIIVAAGQLEYLAGKLHHISGTNAARTLDLEDHYVLNLDSLAKGWKKLAPLPNPRQHAGSVVFENKIYFMGGQYGHDNNLVAQKDVHCYNPVTNTWVKLADLPVPAGAKGRGHISSASIVVGKYIIVLAGETKHSTTRTNMVSAYTPATNTWKNLTPLPQPRHSGVAANLGGIIYYTGGTRSSITYKGTPSIISTPRVDSLTLIDADTDQPIKTLASGDTINLATLQIENINIRANTTPAITGSVKFNLSGPQSTDVIESVSPYALFGDDNNGDYYAWAPPLGKYTLITTPYSGAGATGATGPAKTVIFTVVDSVIDTTIQNVILLSIADAFVRNGTNAGTNYGNDTSLEVKTVTSSGFTRNTYLKFSLNNVSSVGAATLRIYGSNTSDAAAVNIAAYGVNTDSWTEAGIKFNNAPPSLSSPLSSATVTNLPVYYEFDVTDFVKAQLAGDKIVSLFVKDPNNSDKRLIFNSRENVKNVPQLFIQPVSQTQRMVTSFAEKKPSYKF